MKISKDLIIDYIEDNCKSCDGYENKSCFDGEGINESQVENCMRSNPIFQELNNRRIKNV